MERKIQHGGRALRQVILQFFFLFSILTIRSAGGTAGLKDVSNVVNI